MKKNKFWMALCLVVIIAITAHLSIVDSGYCYGLGRKLSEYEVVNKIAAIVPSKNSQSNPISGEIDNCIINDSWNRLIEGNFLNIFFGRKLHAVECVYRENTLDQKYKRKVWYINACNLSITDTTGENISKEEYELQLKENTIYWQGHKK